MTFVFYQELGGKTMKTKIFFASSMVISLILAILLVFEVKAQVIGKNSIPETMVNSTSISNLPQSSQGLRNLGHTMQITFTSASTTYLPLIIKSRHIFDFEDDCQGWGAHPLNQIPQPCQGVTPSTEVAYMGNYSLRFDDLGTYSSTTTQDVGINYDAYNQKVTAHVYLPKGAPSIPVVIYIQDGASVWHQDPFVNLIPGKWKSVSFNLCGQGWPHPYKTLGLHFTPNGYMGSVFIDYVVLEKC
jgi:hypothetical protein